MPENLEMGGTCPHGNNPEECESCKAEGQVEDKATSE